MGEKVIIRFAFNPKLESDNIASEQPGPVFNKFNWHEPAIQSKPKHTTHTSPQWTITWARDTVIWYWPAATLFWQVSIDP